MNHVAAGALEIDALPHYFAAYEDVGQERRVECSHQARPRLGFGLASGDLHVRHSNGGAGSRTSLLVFVLHANAAGLDS